MQRRALLSALASTGALAAAGCLSAPTARTRPPIPEPDPSAPLAVTEFAVETTKTAPTHEWFVRIEGVYSTDAVGRHFEDPTVVDATDVDDPEVREAVKRVLREGKVHTDTIPDGLREFVERVDLVTWDANTPPTATATHWTLAVYDAHPDRDPVLDFDARVTDSGVSADDPAAIELSVTNTGERTQSIFSGPVAPLGILHAERASEADRETPTRFLLWTDYRENEDVSVGDDGLFVNQIGVFTPIDPGETTTRTYRIDPSEPLTDDLAAGEWVVDETLEYQLAGEGQGPGYDVDWRVSFTLAEQ